MAGGLLRSVLVRAALIAATAGCALDAAWAADSSAERPLGVLFDPGAPPPPSAAPTYVPPVATQAAPPRPTPNTSTARPLGLLIDAVPEPAPRPSAAPAPQPVYVPVTTAPAPAGATPGRPLGLLIDTVPEPVRRPAPAPAPQSDYLPVAAPAPVYTPPPAAEEATPGRPLGLLYNPGPEATQPRAQPGQPGPLHYGPVQSRTAPSARTVSAPTAAGVAPTGSSKFKHKSESGEDAPVNLLADEMSFDQENNLVTASGNVEVTYGPRMLYADKLTYNQETRIVTAEGHVSIVEPTGEALFADKVTVTDDLRDGLIRNIGLILADRSRLAAQGAKRSGAVVTELRQGVYSPCNLCADDPDKAPLWQIKAVRVIHDKRAQTIEYRDAWLEFYGLPVVYTPYFIHPDPTVRRRAGFLTPGFGGSSDLGFVVKTPYFYPINKNADVTITPQVSQEEGLLLAADYRQQFKHGELKAQISGTQDSEDDFRGHIFTKGLFDLNQTWRAGFDVNRSTDDTYLRRFGFDSPSVLKSRVYAEGFRGRNYLVANAYSFQDLRATTDSIDSPIVLPLVEYSHVGEPDRLGGNFTMDANLLAITRDGSGNDTRRLSLRPAWHRRFVDSFGNLINFSTGLYADAYNVTDVKRDNKSDFTGSTGRLFPYASLEWRYPLVNQVFGLSQTVEPIFNIVTSPNGGNPSKIPNEDSQEFEFDDTNLFQVNRFGGIDRVEGGTRLNYGIKWGVFSPKTGEVTLLVGQTYRFNDDDTFAEGSGLDDDLSDIVAAARLRPIDYLDITYRTQLKKDGLSPRRHQVLASAGPPLLRGTVSYVFFEQPVDSEFDGREELSLYLTSQLTKTWRTRFQAVRDLAANEMRYASADLIYENECLLVTTRLTRTYYSDRDLKPTDSFTVNLLLKTLGQISF